MDESEKIRNDRERLMLAIEIDGPCALTEHRVIVRRMARRDPTGLSQARERARTVPVGRTREWWKQEARRAGTNWASLLRQRTKVMGWVRAGRPPISEYMRGRDEQGEASGLPGFGDVQPSVSHGGEVRGDSVALPGRKGS